MWRGQIRAQLRCEAFPQEPGGKFANIKEDEADYMCFVLLLTTLLYLIFSLLSVVLYYFHFKIFFTFIFLERCTGGQCYFNINTKQRNADYS